jgi:hypothetical protein
MRRLTLLGAVLAAAVVAGCTAGETPPAPQQPTPTVQQIVAGQVFEVGVPYAYTLRTHCGILTAEFAGRWWIAVEPRPLPGSGNRTAGTMTLVTPDLARFAWPGGTADFTPAGDRMLPLCA